MSRNVQNETISILFRMSDGTERQPTQKELDSDLVPNDVESIVLIAEDGTRSVRFVDGLGR